MATDREQVSAVDQQDTPVSPEQDVIWSVLLDPAWQADDPDRTPPPEAMVGGWRLDEQGRAGKFHPNPRFVPSSPETPTDPVQAVLRLVTRGDAQADEVLTAVHDSMLDVATTQDGELVLTPSPDGVTCALVATSPAHHRPDLAPHWWQLTLEELLAALPDGVDVLLNPGAAESMRLLARPLRDMVDELETSE
jgi:hypothetical protein